MLDVKYSKQAVRFLKNADNILVKRLFDKINCYRKLRGSCKSILTSIQLNYDYGKEKSNKLFRDI